MRLSLAVLSAGKQQGRVLPINLFPFLVGRDPSCHLRPAHTAVGRRHCMIVQRGNRAFLCDLKSTNGTFVNDQPVTGEVELHHGDRVAIGPLLFWVRLPAATSVDSPTPLPPTRAVGRTIGRSASGKLRAKPVGSDSAEYEDLAARLLSDGGDHLASKTVPAERPEVPTVQEPTPPAQAPRPAPPAPDTSSAAASLLELYKKRMRD